MERYFEGKVVLVTGAGKGLGREISLAFAREGALVAANDLTPINLDTTVELIRSQGGQVRDYVFDIAKKMPAQALVQQVLDDWQRVDVLINHASVAPQGRFIGIRRVGVAAQPGCQFKWSFLFDASAWTGDAPARWRCDREPGYSRG